jgi:four helix bundle protein
MFDFEKFKVFGKADEYCLLVRAFIRTTRKLERFERDQLGRSALSVVANIAEGNVMISKKAKKNYFLIAKGSLSENQAILRIMKKENILDEAEYQEFYTLADETARMLSGLIRNLK